MRLLRKAASPFKNMQAQAWTAGERKAKVAEAMAAGEEANKGNPWLGSTKRRDKLRIRLGHWWANGADANILSWIGFGVRLKFEVEPKRQAFANHRSYEEECDHIDAEHTVHVKDGSFKEVSGEEIHICNPLQVEVKEAGGKRKCRMCLDCRCCNSCLADYSFTQETLNKHVAAIIQELDLLITTDVAKAYYQVALHKDSQRYCG